MSYRLVIGVIGADCHAVGNKILSRFFEQAGFSVENLGVMVSQEEFVEAAQQFNADAILVSSIYGHGEIDCEGLREKCVEAGIGKVLLYVGGNLVIGKHSFEFIEQRFSEMGYDRVFSSEVKLEHVVKLLLNDIDSRAEMVAGPNYRAMFGDIDGHNLADDLSRQAGGKYDFES